MVLQAEPEAKTRSQLVANRKRAARAAGLPVGVYAGIAAVAAVQATVIGWYAAHSWFYVDDFIFLRQAKDDGLGASFLRLSLFEHFSPVHRLADWLFIRAAGPSWPVAATILVTLTVACTLAFAYLLSALTRSPGLIVVLTGVYAFSLFFVRTSLWWTAGIHILLVTLFSMLTLGAYVRWYERRSMPSFAVSVGAMALALVTHETGMLLIFVLALLRLLVLAPQPRSMREVYRAFRDDLWIWSCYLVLTALAVANFAAFYWQQQDSHPSVGELARYLWMATGEGFFSTLFLVKIPEVMIHSPGVTAAIAVAAGVVVIGTTVLLRRGAWRPWLFFGLSFLATSVPLGLSRIGQFGVTLGRDPVYQLGPAYLFLVAFAVAVSGPARFEGSERPTAGSPARGDARVALALACAVVVFGVYLRSTSRAVDRGVWQPGATREYFTRLRADVETLSDRGVRVVVFTSPVPESVVPVWEAPYDQLSIGLMVPSLRVSTGEAQYVVTPSGHLERAHLDVQHEGPITAADAAQWNWAPAAGGSCMAPRPGAGPVTVVIPQRVEGDQIAVRIQATSTGRKPASAIVYADNVGQAVTLHAGTNDVAFSGPSVAHVGLALLDNTVCIDRIGVGPVVSGPGS